MGVVRLTLKTVNGELINVDVHSSATIEDLRQHLIQHHNYSSAVQLMFGSKLVDPTRYADEYPHSSLMIVGNKRRTTPTNTPQRSTVSPQNKARVHQHAHADHHHHNLQSPNQSATKGTPQPPRQQQTPQYAEDHTVTPQSRSPRGLALSIVVPLTEKAFELQLAPDATLSDLITAAVAEDPSTVGCRVMCKGKVLVGSDKVLHSLGVRSGNTIFLATGFLADIQLFKLFQARREFEEVKRIVNEAGASLQEQERKGYYEQLMKVLLGTDELQDLEGEWRLKRKELVKEITAFQDCLKS